MEAIFGELIPTYGLHNMELDVNGHFVWAKGKFGLRTTDTGRFYAARMCYYGDAGELHPICKQPSICPIAHKLRLSVGH